MKKFSLAVFVSVYILSSLGFETLPAQASGATGHWIKNCAYLANPDHVAGMNAALTLQCAQAYVPNGSKGHWIKNCAQVPNPNHITGLNNSLTVQCSQTYIITK
jgi:hypothetical protein